MNILVIKLSPLRGVTSSMMRTIGLVKGFRDLGHEVDLLTTPEANQLIAMRSDRPLENAGVRLLQTAPNQAYVALVSGGQGLKRRLVNLLRKAYHAASMYDNTIRIAKSIALDQLKPAYDLVVSVSDPKSAHVAVQRLRAQGLKVRRWVQYWGDPMTLDITNKSVMPRFVYQWEERKLLADCDKIFYTNPFTLDMQRRLFPEFAPKMDSTPTALSKELNCVHEPGSAFRVSYIGAYHSRVRNILPFYQASLRFEDGIETYIVGDSDHQLSGTDNVHILPRGDVSDIELNTDLFICVLNHSGTQIPGKVYHYAASNRPILVVLDGDKKEEIRAYLERFGRYLFCDNDTKQIVRAIQSSRHSAQEWGRCAEMLPMNVAMQFVVP